MSDAPLSDPFVRDHQPQVGQAVELAPGVRVVTAPNPGPMTFTGTQSYILGIDPVIVVDPGPQIAAHLDALVAAIGAATVSHILITHAHVDHSPLSRDLQAATGVPILGFGRPEEARSPLMQRLAESGALGGGEGIDADYVPDQNLSDGDAVPLENPTGQGGSWDIRALYTPGHLSDHLCFELGDTGQVLSGDHVMSWATTMVSPPDGDLTRFMASLDWLAARSPQVLYPGHGVPVRDPMGMISHQKSHRKGREAQILQGLRDGPQTPWELTQSIYTDVDPRLHPAAARNVLAHLIDLIEQGRVSVPGTLSADAQFTLTEK